MTEVAPENLPRRLLPQRDGQVSGAAAQIQNTSIWSGEDRANSFNGPSPPQLVDVGRKQVVQQVIARRDLAKHVPDPGSSLTLVADSFRSRTAHCMAAMTARVTISSGMSDRTTVRPIRSGNTKCTLP